MLAQVLQRSAPRAAARCAIASRAVRQASPHHGVWVTAAFFRTSASNCRGAAYTAGARIRRRPRDSTTDSSAIQTSEGLGEDLDNEVHKALSSVLSGEEPLELRLAAVQSLAETATSQNKHPCVDTAAQVENALHQVLLEIAGPDAERVQQAVEEALWKVWHHAEDPDVAELMRRGVAYMEKEHLTEAVDMFSQVIEKDPGFAEGWNKRATAYFLLHDFDKSIKDCHKVLEIKPRHFGCLTGLGMCHQGRGEDEEAVTWFKEALRVHPQMEGHQKIISTLEQNSIMNRRLRPRLVQFVQALNDGTELQVTQQEGLSCGWEVYRIASPAGRRSGKEYFVRVRVSNLASRTSQVQSLARFYVLRFEGGRMVPLVRMTEGPAKFKLKPGEEHRMSWRLFTRHELESAAAGLLLEDVDDKASTEHIETRLLDADLGAAVPSIQISEDEVERLRLGHIFTGCLDLRRLATETSPGGSDGLSSSVSAEAGVDVRGSDGAGSPPTSE